MRVTHVVTQIGTYGGERFVPALARAQRERGIDASVVTLYGDDALVDGVPVFSAHRGDSPGFFFRLTNRLRALQPDVVHTHLAHGKTWGRLAALATRAAVVHTEHANDFGGSAGYKSLGRLLHARSRRIVGFTQAHAERIGRIEGVPAERVAVISNGIEFEDRKNDRAAVRGSLGVGERDALVLFIGRLDAVKEPLCMVDAMALLPKRARLVVAGDGPLRDAVLRRARAFRIDDRVLLLGYRDDVPCLVAAADVVVNCSSTEAMPLSLIEAICAGVPVVATPWPGAQELVGDSGVVCACHGPTAVAAAIERALEIPHPDSARLAEMRERFSIARAAKAHEMLYDEILSQSEVTMNDEQGRKSREKRLQDERFSQGGSRGKVDGAYAITGASHGYYKRRLKEDAPGRRLLEIGCGLGESALELAKAGGSVTGIDLSDVAVDAARAKARERNLDARFEAMDAERTTFEDKSFDVVCGGAILHHLDTERAYREVARLLAPDGYGIFLEPLGYNPFINLYRRLTPKLRTPDEHPLLERDLELAARYFKERRITYYYLTTLLTLPLARTRAGKALIAAANAIDRVLFRVFPALRRQAWFIVLELRSPIPTGT